MSQTAELGVESGLRQNQTAVRHDRFGDHRSHASFVQGCGNGGHIVERNADRRRGRRTGQPQAIGLSGVPQHLVEVAVVLAGEGEHQVAPGPGARQA
jgi:hypothetical protein